MKQYEFDKSSFSFNKVSRTFGKTLWTVVKYALVIASLAFVYYVIFAFVVNTDKEKILRDENRMYQKIYSQMYERERLVGAALNGLQAKDAQIYSDIFNSEAPAMDPVNNLDYLSGSDTIPDNSLVKYTTQKLDELLEKSSEVEANFRKIFERYSDEEFSRPPMSLPLESLTHAQVGASVGQKINPFYKVESHHSGLDMIAPQGSPVFATADGVVEKVTRAYKGDGNVIEISHSGGYKTRYCHLDDMLVRAGQKVEKGRVIGHVGVSGNSFAPHLHYEIIRDTLEVDPIHYFFASVSPDEYANMLYMSSRTGQSLD